MHENQHSSLATCFLSIKQTVFNLSNALLCIWVLWLGSGTVFYHYTLDIPWEKGLYMTVNVGYSIGWGDISEQGNLSSQWFSIFFVLCGASAVAAALGSFAQSILKQNSSWYTNELSELAYKDQLAAHGNNPCMLFSLWFAHDFPKLRPVLLWIMFIGVCTGCAMHYNNWPFVTALYFAIASLSTG